MTVITTNTLSMGAQANLKRANSSLATAMERLSSGLRVNGAKDDAAGQAIGNRMTSQVNGHAMAQRNANDGVSLAQTAQGVLDSINDKLQRIRELTVQGLNEIYNGEMGDKIQAEINLSLKEIDRLVEVSNYNGISLLDGKAGPIPLQVGSDDNQVVNIDLGSPGFSVEEIGLLNMTFQGEPGTITPVATLTDRSSRVPLDSDLTSLAYVPSENSPNLVSGATGSPTRPTLIQYGGETGQLHNYASSVTHDTDTLENTVRLSTTTTAYPRTAAQSIWSRTYLDSDGAPLTLNSPSIVSFDGDFWIQERVAAGHYRYHQSELTIEGDTGRITAQAISDGAVVEK